MGKTDATTERNWRFGENGAAAERREIAAAVAAGRGDEYMAARDDYRASRWCFGRGQTDHERAREERRARQDGLWSRYVDERSSLAAVEHWNELRAAERVRKAEARRRRSGVPSSAR